MSQTLYVQCGLGLERALAEELAELGPWSRCLVEPGGVEVEGPPGAHELVNRWSRVANRVLLRVGEVPRPEALAQLRLQRFGGRFSVEATGEGAGRWRAVAQRAFGDEEGGVGLFLRVRGGRAVVSVDTSGELLYFRGYRQELGRAPLRETLAAGVLRLAGYAPAQPLWDVMCGSGTFLIEAAELSRGLAPGRNRRFAFESFPEHGAAAATAGPRRAAPSVAPAPIIGSDLNAGALGVARRNARRAGVLDALTLERLDATRLAPRPGVLPGLVVANLPYGKRVGEASERVGLYRRVGAALQRACVGWRFALLVETGAEDLGLPFTGRHPVSNGGLRCELLVGRLDG